MIKVKVNLKPLIGRLDAKKAPILEAAKLKLLSDLKAATPVDTGHARDGWKLDGNKIINDVDYIKELNNGSSKQAPRFFVELTVLKSKLFRFTRR